MTLNRLKHIAIGVALYAAGNYLLRKANQQLENSINEGFDIWRS
jgi:hypothetical protein